MSTLHAKTSYPSFDPLPYQQDIIAIIRKIQHIPGKLTPSKFQTVLRQYPKDGTGYFKKSDIIAGYRLFAGSHGLPAFNPEFIHRIQMKPVRTISGVTPITVLTKPFPCPGKCIFCPNDVRMPKSYLSNEPGAQRAEKNHFDPYLQTYNRLLTYKDIGHNYQKAELIVLGGTWSIYPVSYQIWFVKRMFEALNDFAEGIDQRSQISPSINVSAVSDVHQDLVEKDGKLENSYNQVVSKLYQDQEAQKKRLGLETATWEELYAEHQRNQSSTVKCVGLVLETRPDHISEQEVITLRKLGCTKTQIGLQSLQDKVLQLNKRGHDVAASRRAMRLLRQAGLKIHAHWMPNLYGSSVAKDIKDYQKLFQDPDFKPDELKIYPCSLIEKTDLMAMYHSGKWTPYSPSELLEVLTQTMHMTPEYCRLTRIVRDIPSDDIVAGNKLTNFRQIAHQNAVTQKVTLSDIRAREIKGTQVKPSSLKLKTLCYHTSTSIEYFLQYVNRQNQIAGFLRLSLPFKPSYITEIKHAAIIREVHVYGQAINIGETKSGKAQHAGLGTKLITRAEKIAKKEKFTQIAVISAIGTREYYAKFGYQLDELYQIKQIS